MANWSDPRVGTAGFAGGTAGARDTAYDTGLRSYMLSVYNRMTSAVLLTGIVALLFSLGGRESPAAQIILGGGPLAWIIMLAPLGFVLALSFGANRMKTSTMSLVFWAFAGLSLYGYTTKRDLAPFGTFLIMGVVGIFVASLINLFLQSSAMQLIISVIGVLLFAGLTAYDTQKIKSMYFEVRGTDFAGKAAILGALNLYMDFINMFLFILRLFGGNRN